MAPVDVTGTQFFGSTAAKQRAHLVEHLLFGGDLTLFGQIPGCAEGTAARHNAYFHQRISMLTEPRHGGVACLVECYGALFIGCHNLRFLLQTTDNAVYGVEEVLSSH